MTTRTPKVVPLQVPHETLDPRPVLQLNLTNPEETPGKEEP